MSGERAIRSRKMKAGQLTIVVLVAFLTVGIGTLEVRAQERLSDFSDKPILVLDTGGHHAPVRKLVFTQDETRLLSAGQDKVVRVWDLSANPPKLDWTIRPPIWRAQAGAINGMALTAPDAQGRQTLALAGYGVDSLRGEIGLYHFPGAANRREGDIEAYLAHRGENRSIEQSTGHLNTVSCLAFSPDGSILASGSTDLTVRLWDYQKGVQLAYLPHGPLTKVNALAFTPDGLRLATGGSDGTLRIWNVATRRVTVEAPPFVGLGQEKDIAGVAINALDVSPDGQWVVIGREDGRLFRYDLRAANLNASRLLFTTGAQQGPVEGLAFGPRNQLVTSIVSRRMVEKPTMADRPTVACDIEFHDILAPIANAVPLAKTTNLAYALAFSPKGSYLAYAGGDRQNVKLVDLRVADLPTRDLSNSVTQGQSIWDVGFVGNTTVAYAYEQPTAPPPAEYYGFDLKNRVRMNIPTEQVRSKAVQVFEDWTVRPIDSFLLEVSRGGNPKFRVQLSDLEGRWWNYSYLRPGPNHDRPALAIACDRCVVIYRLDDRPEECIRTRLLDGHNGAVYCLAPSPDGKWLATGSSDQCIRFWPLAGVDVLAPLGAEFELKAGVLSVKSVAKDGFAEYSGMQDGDIVDLPILRGSPVLRGNVPAFDVFLRDYPSLPPGLQIAYSGHRQKPGGIAESFQVGTTKRERPSLSLFVGRDREWVLWMPRGFYDSSVIGDSTFLGWQVNNYQKDSKDKPSPTDYFKMVTYEEALRQPKGTPQNAIDDLLGLAIRLPPQPPPLEKPSVVTALLGAGSAPARGPDGKAILAGSPMPGVFSMPPGPLVLNWKIEPKNEKPPGPFEIRRGGLIVRPAGRPPFDPNAKFALVPMRYDLNEPGSYLFTGTADLGQGNQRELTITAVVDGKPPIKPGSLRILRIVPSFLDSNINPIEAGDRDARDLLKFMHKHMVTESGGRFSRVETNDGELVGEGATVDKVRAALDRLSKEPVGPDDLVVVLLETYVLDSVIGAKNRIETRIVLSDSRGAPPLPASTISADEINKALDPLVKNRGCKVILVLDGSHETPGWEKVNCDVQEWARVLRNQYQIITVLATTGKPINKFVGDNRPLAEAILNSILAKNPRPNDPMMTLPDFRQAIYERVAATTKGQGEPEVYVPTILERPFPILNRKP